MPWPQAKHESRPNSSWYLPLGQRPHAFLPATATNFPGGQSWHVAAGHTAGSSAVEPAPADTPTREKRPAAHASAEHVGAIMIVSRHPSSAPCTRSNLMPQPREAGLGSMQEQPERLAIALGRCQVVTATTPKGALRWSIVF